MPLENATTIAQLDDRYPLSTDPGSRGDDHFRLIKAVLKKQFPGKDGNGFKVPITLSEDFLNGLPTQLTKMQDDIDKRWPVGAALLLFTNQDPNADYPGTWALVTGDASLALGDGSNNVGSIAGSNTPVVPLLEHSHTASFTGSPLPGHSHTFSVNWLNTSQQQAGAGLGGPTFALNQGTSSVSAGTPAGSVAIGNAGAAGVTLNVRGAQIKVNVWKRVS